MKARRHAKLLEIIKQTDVETQEELLKCLQQAGFAVTQATVSRDIKELRLVKTADDMGRYRYTAEKTVSKGVPPLDGLFVNAIEEIEPAMNMIAVKCMPGMAQAVCVALEGLCLAGVVGTLAGDDTIFILCKDVAAANSVTVTLKNMTRG